MTTPGETWYQLDVGYACGAIGVRDGIIFKTAPIFYRLLLGVKFDEIKKRVPRAKLQLLGQFTEDPYASGC